MAAAWVLILMLSSDHGVAVGHVEFADKASCESARVAVLKEEDGTSVHVRAVCAAATASAADKQ